MSVLWRMKDVDHVGGRQDGNRKMVRSIKEVDT